MTAYLTRGIDNAFAERIDLLVLALTGRTGSGCSTAARALSEEFENIPINFEDLSDIETRKYAICAGVAKNNWVPFKTVTVSTVLLSFLIQEPDQSISKFIHNQTSDSKIAQDVVTLSASLRASTKYAAFLSLVNEYDQDSSSDAWDYFERVLSPSASKLKSILNRHYAPTMQTIGDNIRKSGSAISDAIDPQQIFTLIRRVKRLTKAAIRADRRDGRPSTRVAIDAVRNPLELVYLRDQFASFYSIAITAPDDHRIDRLQKNGLTPAEIEELDNREYGKKGKKSLKNYENFVSQNLLECIQKSDIFISNVGLYKQRSISLPILHRQLVRYVSLMLRPGLVTPTSDERSMQLAFVAKLNSGCISRQVGAAVTDPSASIKAVGWNDVPKGQVPCLLRDVTNLLGSGDKNAFSEFESTDEILRSHLETTFQDASFVREQTGANCPFCFKDAYNAIVDGDNQVHTRALHAEENAFLQLAKYGNSGIINGTLYTTASPCELCSKKAYQLGISEIVFVDPYPGISAQHVLASGIQNLRPKLRLFGGAVGHAYHRLYEPVLSIKDELMARLAEINQLKT